jgi:hypothetical protein
MYQRALVNDAPVVNDLNTLQGEANRLIEALVRHFSDEP